MTVVVGSDHAGHATKQAVLRELARAGYTVVDVGGFDPKKSDDYVDYAEQVGKAVAADKGAKGILICGSGTGMVIAANKIPGVRAAFAWDTYSARMARKDNDANVIALRGRRFPAKEAAKLALTFLRAEFTGAPRHKRRIRKIRALER